MLIGILHCSACCAQGDTSSRSHRSLGDTKDLGTGVVLLRIHSQLKIFREASSCRAASEFPDLPRRNSSRDT